MMKKIHILFFIMSVGIVAKAQTLSPQVISSGGNYGSSSVGTISYTIGQPSAVTTATSSNAILTQGFQQVDNLSTGISQVSANVLNNMLLYPNPASNLINLKCNFIKAGNLQAIIFNSLGQQIKTIQNIACIANTESVTSFNTQAFAVANYILYLKFTDENGVITEGNLKFTITKN